MSSSDWPKSVLRFWFEELTPADWFKGGSALDERIRERFAELHAEIAAKPVSDLTGEVETARASVIVLDQFSRHIHRGHADAFASDPKALDIARHVIESGWTAGLSVDERLFVYLPFEHSERLVDQDISVRLCTALGNEGYTDYAERHRDVIRRFGRFPHRNAVLQRPSTAEEIVYLAEGGGF